MARRVFFSFHYQRDVWRVNQIRNIGEVVGSSAAGFQDASLWEEAKRKGDAAVMRCISYERNLRKKLEFILMVSMASNLTFQAG